MNDAIDDLNIDFRSNPERALWVEGRLDDALLERLRPEIAELCRNRDPITLFINSSGGKPEVQYEIGRLLRAPRKDGSRASIITVAAPRAASAAANLLSAGDFAIAWSNAHLLYHGGRWPLSDLLEDGEAGLIYARTLPTFREMTAASLAANCARRFIAIVSAHRPLFASQSERADQALDLKSFQLILREKLSESGRKVLDRAIDFDDVFNGVVVEFQKRLRRGRIVTKTHLRKLMLQAAIGFEYGTGSEKELGWDGGLGRITDHFYSLNSYFDIEKLCEWIASRPSSQAPDVEADYLLRFRQFFLSICRALQSGENNITPSDALYLGLIDSLRDGPMPGRPGCQWCSRDFGSWPAAKIHVKNCADAPRPRWKEFRKRLQKLKAKNGGRNNAGR